MTEKWKNMCSEQCYEFLKLWSDKLKENENDPIRFIREVVNPFSRERRSEGKKFDTVIIKGTKDKPCFITSEEERKGKGI